MAQPDEHSGYSSLVSLIRQLKRGIISPSQVWEPILFTLPPESAWGFLDSLPDDLKLFLRREYFGMARHWFEPPAQTADLRIAKVIAQWCEQQGDPDASPKS